jgi:hypothetical protein
MRGKLSSALGRQRVARRCLNSVSALKRGARKAESAVRRAETRKHALICGVNRAKTLARKAMSAALVTLAAYRNVRATRASAALMRQLVRSIQSSH